MNALLMLQFADGPVSHMLYLIYGTIACALLIELRYRLGGVA